MRDRRQVLAGGFLAAGAATAGAACAAAADEPTPRALAERFAAALSAHDMDAFAALFAEDYVNHQASAAAPAPPGRSAKQATLAFFQGRLAGLPDLAVAVEALVGEADRVAASFVYTGTHRAPYLGVAPTGRVLRFTSCDIFAIRAGLIAEHWGMGDIAGVMAQLRG